MSFGLFRSIFADHGGAIATGRRMLGYRLDESSAEGLYELICGQVTFNVEIDARTFDIGLPIDIDAILSSIAEDPACASYPEFGLYAQAMGLTEAISAYGEAEGQRRHAALWQFHAAMTKSARDILPPLSAARSSRSCAAPWSRSPPSLLTSENAALLAFFQRRIDHLRQFSCVWFVVAARLGFYFADMVRWRLEHHLGEPALAQTLFQGLEGSLITRQAIELENLAQGRITQETFLRAMGTVRPTSWKFRCPACRKNPEISSACCTIWRCRDGGRATSFRSSSAAAARLNAMYAAAWRRGGRQGRPSRIFH